MSGWRDKTILSILIFLRVIVLWNDFPQDLQCITLLTTFKREIINFFKTKLEHYCLPGTLLLTRKISIITVVYYKYYQF